jgi:hypothetical protein
MITAISHQHDFDAAHRRLRCGPHTRNLIRQALLFGKDKDASNDKLEDVQDKEASVQQWRTLLIFIYSPIT